ncbi:MAG: hypothetical protein R3F21_03600 [Myxococcota bacterium]
MRSRMRSRKALLVALAGLTGGLAGSSAASAQVLVGLQQRLFQKYSNGRMGPDVVPCCLATSMNPVPTVDARTEGSLMSPHFSEYKNRTAMVGNLLGLGTPAALSGNGPPWYGLYNTSGGVTIRAGRYTTRYTQMVLFPNATLRRLSTFLDRSVQDQVLRPGGGPGEFRYEAWRHAPDRPTFRDPTTWLPYPSMAGQISVGAGPNQFGGTRSIVQEEVGIAVAEHFGLGYRLQVPFEKGPGTFFTPLNVVRRATASGTYAHLTIPSPMATTGMVILEGQLTAWFTILPYTTGWVFVSAPTGSIHTDFEYRSEMGFNDLHATSMGGVTGQLQLVSAHLVQSRGPINQSHAGTHMTRITFTPEPASAVLLGAGALVLVASIGRDAARARMRR